MNGDISAVIDSLEYSINDYLWQTSATNLIHIADNTYATCLGSGWLNPNYLGFMHTLDIDNDGNVTSIDSWQFGTTDDCKGYNPNSILVPNTNFYLMLRSDSTWDVQATTTTIDNDGTISKSYLSEVKLFEYGTGSHVCWLKSGEGKEYFVAVNRGVYDTAPADHGAIALFSVDTTTGVITLLDGTEFDSVGGQAPQVYRLSDDAVAIYYADPSTNTAQLKTWTISGDIVGDQIDSLQIASDCSILGWGTNPRMCHLINDIFVCTHSDNVNDGHISTVSIDNSGNISDTVIDTLNTSHSVQYTDIAYVNDSTIGLTFVGPTHVNVETYEIASDGTINTTRLSVQDIVAKTTESYFCRLTFIPGSTDKWAVTTSKRSASAGGAFAYTVAIEGTDIDAVDLNNTIAVKDVIFDEILINDLHIL